MNKIFGIGFARTGTTTLTKALEILGYKSIHVECNVMEVTNVDGTDSFDINNESWLHSCSLGFTDKMIMDQNHKMLHRCLYNSRLYDKDKFLNGYKKFVDGVLSYFSNDSSLLVYDICLTQKWNPLCCFLNKDIPDCPLPHESKRRTNIKEQFP